MPVISAYRESMADGFSSGALSFKRGLGLIITLVNIYPQTTIVIDALDECDPSKRGKFLTSLRTIVNSTTSLVKIFVSSRDDDDIVLRLEKTPNLWIKATDNTGDIKRFVELEVERVIEDGELLRGKVSEKLKQSVITTLINGSHGMYMPKSHC